MAAASAVKGEEPSEIGHNESQNNVPLKAEGNQDSLKQTARTEKQGTIMDNGKSLKEKNDKSEQVGKKFVDAPLPATNVWIKRSASSTSASESSQTLSSTEPNKETSGNDKAPAQGNAVQHKPAQGNAVQHKLAQGNAVSHKPAKSGKGSVSDPERPKPDKPKPEKSKTDLNGSRQTENNQKQKSKKFGDNYVEAPLPTVNPWKKPSTPVTSVPVSPFGTEQDPTPAGAAMSPGVHAKDVWPVEQPADSRKEARPPETVQNEMVSDKSMDPAPALADDNWPTLHELVVTEPLQTMPSKPLKSPKVKTSSTTSTTPSGSAPVAAADIVPTSPVISSTDTQPAPSDISVNKSAEVSISQTQLQSDSGGDDSSKENKDSTTNGDDASGSTKGKKGTKPKWQRMEIDHPKPDRRNRRSRSQGRAYSPHRRDGKPAGDRFNRPNSRRTDGPESQNWRANMISQSSTSSSPTSTTESGRGGAGGSFPGRGGFRGRGGSRGNAPRRGGGGRGRGGGRDTKSPPVQPNPNSWSAQDQAFHNISADAENIPVAWSQGYNRVPTVPRVPPIHPTVMLGIDPNLFIHEQLLNIIGQASVFYEQPSPSKSETLMHQVEYYFSEENLVKDLFLRKKMDKTGWVRLELVLSFNKVKELKADYKSLIQAIRNSDKLELSENEDYVRRVHSPEVWPLEDDFKGLPPPPAIQMVAAMSTLHSDAPEFVPGKPFVLRNLSSDAPEFIPAAAQDVHTNSGSQQARTEEEEDNLLCDAASNLTTIPPMLSSR